MSKINATAVIEARITLIDPKYRSLCREILLNNGSNSMPLTISQAQQDWFLYHNYFRTMTQPGAYLDLGSNDARELSNTFFFDKCLGWKGVCVEPNPMYEAGYKDRSCRLLKNCVWKSRKIMRFHHAETTGGIKGDVQPNSNGTTVQCITIEDILRENSDILGSPDENGALGTNLNYVSFDAEGSEPEVLSCLDFQIFSSTNKFPRVWSIETNKDSIPNGLRIIDASMNLGGFTKVLPLLQYDASFLDDLYVFNENRNQKYYLTKQQSCEKMIKKKSCSLFQLMNKGTFQFQC